MISGVQQDLGNDGVSGTWYNHSNAAEDRSPTSVLDKIVRGYHQRLN